MSSLWPSSSRNVLYLTLNTNVRLPVIAIVHSHSRGALPGATHSPKPIVPLHYVASSISTERSLRPRAMPLVTLPPDVSSLLARWQAAHDMTDITNQLVDETRALLTALTTLSDQRTQLTNFTEQVRQLTEEQTLALNNAEIAETTICTLRGELAAARATVNVLTRAAEAVPTELRITTGREKIPDPEHFDGTCSKLPNFLMQLELKAASYNDEQTKLRLAVNYLRGDAADLVRSYVRNGRVNLPNLAALQSWRMPSATPTELQSRGRIQAKYYLCILCQCYCYHPRRGEVKGTRFLRAGDAGCEEGDD